MKLIYVALLLAFVCASSCAKNTLLGKNDQLDDGWTFVSDSLLDAIDIFFVNDTNGMALSFKNIYVTTNGGQTWYKKDTGKFHSSLSMGSAAVAFASGTLNRIRATRDSGRTFRDIILPESESLIYDCFFVNESTCFAVGESKFWKTTDKGNSWSVLYAFPNPSKNYRSLYFLDENNGWVLSGEELIKTVDGGRSWTKVNTGLKIPFSGGAIQFLNPQEGFFSDYAGIGKTLDGGDTWVNCFMDAGLNNSLIDIHFFSSEEGYACLGNRIIKTSNGGQDWKTVVSLGNSKIYEIHFINSSLGWACTNRGILKYSFTPIR